MKAREKLCAPILLTFLFFLGVAISSDKAGSTNGDFQKGLLKANFLWNQVQPQRMN
jgi:hypothetical protein